MWRDLGQVGDSETFRSGLFSLINTNNACRIVKDC